jgi:phospholipid transport system substrate-binding protein
MIWTRIGAVVLLGLVAAGLGGAAWGAPALGPGATLRQEHEAILQLLRHKAAKGTPAAELEREQLRRRLDALVDYQAFARQSLGDHWDGLKRRDEVLAVFKQMLEGRYLQQLRAGLDAQVTYGGEQGDGKQVSVTTTIGRAASGTVDEEIVYKLHRVEQRWMVYDIVSDEVSLVRNYKTQLHKIISEQGADKLIEKMKSKL